MEQHWHSIISQQWIADNLDSDTLILADCRFSLADSGEGRRLYQEGHLPGAYHFDLEQDLSGPLQAHGGRHPLPDPELLAGKLRQVGIDEQCLVVAYDDQLGAGAARFWWLLRYLGHGNVGVMDGSFDLWVRQGYPVSTDIPHSKPAPFAAHVQPYRKAEVDDVRKQVPNGKAILVDAREATRFQGIEEPIDPKAGHIPGAVNVFWKDNVDSQGRWHFHAVKDMARHLSPDQEIIVYCGSGVTACPVILGFEELGFTHVRLYAGSWSDWISYPDNPAAGLGQT